MTKYVCVLMVCAFVSLGTVFGDSGKQGVKIKPDKQGKFEYLDDFSTPRFLVDGFVEKFTMDNWQKGALVNRGPNRGRKILYRFYADRTIEQIAITVEQSANGRSLGGRNRIFLSNNGLDWTLMGDSGKQKPDGNGWQNKPFKISSDQAKAFLGKNEIWVRLTMDNSSGLKTNVSNSINSLKVSLKLGAPAGKSTDIQTTMKTQWGALQKKQQWGGATLDCADPVEHRAPHYYEDSDGWLKKSGSDSFLNPDETLGFPVRCAYVSTPRSPRSPLSLAAFVKTTSGDGMLMARIVVRSGKNSSRKMNVLWDRKPISTYDVGSYFEKDQVFFITIPGPQVSGIHELRITGGDDGLILVRRITLAGAGKPMWVEKPELPRDGKLKVISSYYMPDPAPPEASQAVEGRHAKQESGLIFPYMQRLYKEHADFGAIRIALKNEGTIPVRIAGITLNNKPVEQSYVNFVKDSWDARGVVWYRVRPRLVNPGQCSQIYIRFRRRPAGNSAKITINLENGSPIKVTVPYKNNGMTIDYVTTDASMSTLYVYARRSAKAKPGNVVALTLDGKRLDNAKIYGATFPGNIALIVAKLPKPLQAGQYHVAGVKAGMNKHICAQFRVLPFMFPLSSIHIPAKLCNSMNMNVAMWYRQSLATCEKYDIWTTGVLRRNLFDYHKRIAYILGPDEPDAKDNRGGGYGNGLGFHARQLAENGWQELVERFVPSAATWIIMNGTVRPLNWAVYGQFADIACSDPYPVTYYAADHALVRETLISVRRCGTPNRMYACLETYGWKSGQGVPKNARGPSPEEYRQNVVQAIGAGMKGLTSWVYVTSAGGWQNRKRFTQEIIATNALIKNIERELLLGTPIDLATSDAGLVPTGVVGEEKWPKPRVWVMSLLCGPDTIILTAANHIPASKPDLPKIKPAKNVTITVNLPNYISNVQAFEVTDKGLLPFTTCSVSNGKAILKLNSITAGRVFVLKRQ